MTVIIFVAKSTILHIYTHIYTGMKQASLSKIFSAIIFIVNNNYYENNKYICAINQTLLYNPEIIDLCRI